MNLKKLALVAAAGTTLLAAAPVFADPGHWAPAHGWRHHYPHYVYGYRAPAYVYYPAQPVYVPPPVAYYPPQPVYVPPPRPVIYGQVPLNHGARVGFAVGL